MPGANHSGFIQAYRIVQALTIAVGLILVSGIFKIASAPYIAFAFGGSLFLFLGTETKFQDVLKCLAAGCAFYVVYLLLRGPRIPYFGWQFGTVLGFLGMGAVQILAAKWIWAEPPDRKRTFLNLRRACVIPSVCLGSMCAVGVAAQLTPQTYDPAIFAFDGKFGWPSWIVGGIFQHHPVLLATSGFVYNSLPLALSACLVLQWLDKLNFPVDLGMATVSLGVVGFLLYQICPVSGPIYLFPNDFPAQIPHVLNQLRIGLPPVARNGMPSLHVAWALLLVWNLRGKRWLAPASVLYLAFTILATLGSGEHYFADLMLSPALVLAIQSAYGGVVPSLRPFCLMISSAVGLGWLLAFRTGAALLIPPGGAAWLFAALSILLPAALGWKAPVTVAGADRARLTSSDPGIPGTFSPLQKTAAGPGILQGRGRSDAMLANPATSADALD